VKVVFTRVEEECTSVTKNLYQEVDKHTLISVTPVPRSQLPTVADSLWHFPSRGAHPSRIQPQNLSLRSRFLRGSSRTSLQTASLRSAVWPSAGRLKIKAVCEARERRRISVLKFNRGFVGQECRRMSVD
jgi:hypothetical protein